VNPLLHIRSKTGPQPHLAIEDAAVYGNCVWQGEPQAQSADQFKKQACFASASLTFT